jgi:putative acetyltransferase
VEIRPERPSDYAAVARVHALAFDNRASEPAVVALRRQASSYDPELALVAEADGEVVGHALFTPETIRLLGRDLRAVNLAPLAVLPAYQRRRVGAALIEEGHRVARSKGFALSFLLGRPEYYARFGYLGGVFGVARLTVSSGAGSMRLEAHPPREPDQAALHALWLEEEGAVDFAIDPGPDLLGWVSPNPTIESLVWTAGGEVAGYTRVSRAEPASVRMFLAREDASHALVTALSLRYGLGTSIDLPLHPACPSAARLGAAICEPWEAGMACALAPSPLEEYVARLGAGLCTAGRPIWPVVFDVA